MTPPEIADYLDVGEEEVALWFRHGQLVADARNESGQPLAYRWRVKRDGPGLAAGERVRITRRSGLPSRKVRAEILIDPPTLPCGCSIDPDTRRTFFLCPDARALQSAERLASAFALAAPDDRFFRRLAAVTREAFERHIADPGQPNATAPPGRDGAQLLACGQTPPSDCAPLRRHTHQTR